MRVRFIVSTLSVFLVSATGYGQQLSKSPLSNADFLRMNKVELKQKGELAFENSRLYKVNEDSIFLAVPHFNGQYYTNHHSVARFDMDNVDEVLIRNRKKSNLYSIIGGVVLGTASFFIAKEVFFRPKERLSLVMLGMVGQEYESAVWEPYAAATLGLGTGVLIGTSLAESKVYPSDDPKYAYWKMKTMSYKKKRK